MNQFPRLFGAGESSVSLSSPFSNFLIRARSPSAANSSSFTLSPPRAASTRDSRRSFSSCSHRIRVCSNELSIVR